MWKKRGFCLQPVKSIGQQKLYKKLIFREVLNIYMSGIIDRKYSLNKIRWGPAKVVQPQWIEVPATKEVADI